MIIAIVIKRIRITIEFNEILIEKKIKINKSSLYRKKTNRKEKKRKRELSFRF